MLRAISFSSICQKYAEATLLGVNDYPLPLIARLPQWLVPIDSPHRQQSPHRQHHRESRCLHRYLLTSHCGPHTRPTIFLTCTSPPITISPPCAEPRPPLLLSLLFLFYPCAEKRGWRRWRCLTHECHLFRPSSRSPSSANGQLRPLWMAALQSRST